MTGSDRRSGGKDVRWSPPVRRSAPIHVASGREIPLPPPMFLPPTSAVFPRRLYLKQRSGCSNSLRRLQLPAWWRLTRWVMGPTQKE